MALTIEEIQAFLADSESVRVGSDPSLREEEKPGALGNILSFVNRPFSAVAGGITALQEGQLPFERIGQALSGEEDFSSIDIAERLGFDPDSNLVKGLSLASDVAGLGLLDPLNLITLGTTRAGAVARIAGKFPASRAQAAAQGLFGAVNVAGQPVLPRALSAVAGGALDVTGRTLRESRVGQVAGKVFKSRRSLEKGEFKEAAEFLKDLNVDKEMEGRAGNILARQFAEENPEGALRAASAFIEKPGLVEPGATLSIPTQLSGGEVSDLVDETLTRRLGQIQVTLKEMNEGNIIILPADISKAFPGDDDLLQAANAATQRVRHVTERANVKKEIEDREEWLLSFWDPATGKHTVPVKSRKLFNKRQKETSILKDRLHDLSSRSPDLAKGDDPIEQFQNAIRLRLIDEQDRIMNAKVKGGPSDKARAATETLDKALLRTLDPKLTAKTVKLENAKGVEIKMTPEVQAIMDEVQPHLDFVEEAYNDLIRPYNPDFEFPIDNYLPHFWPERGRGVFKKGASNQKKLDRLTADFRQSMLARGAKDSDRVDSVARSLAQRMMGRGGRLTTKELKGDFAQFMPRGFDFTIQEINLADLGFEFEDHMALIVNKHYQGLSKFKYGLRANEFLAEKHSITSDVWAALDAADQKQFVKMNFHVYGVPGDKQPFDNLYVPKDAMQLMQGFQQGADQITTNEGFRAVLDTMHSVRRWWTSWTLAPFPAFHARNVGSQILLMMQGGLNIVRRADRDSFKASTEMLNLGRLGRSFGGSDETLPNLTRIIEELKAVYPDADITKNSLHRILKREQLIDTGYRRDLEAASMMEDLTGTVAAKSLPSKLASVLDPRTTKNPIVRFGFNTVGQPIEDLPRAALFLDRLRKTRAGQPIGAVMDWERAVDEAVTHTRKFLHDPTPAVLSPVENDIAKLLFPFYQWSRQNIPLQVEQLLTRPGSFAPLSRALFGARNNFAEQFDPLDAPEWITNELGLPIRRVKDADGVIKMSFWLPTGWIPATELNEFADMMRGDFGQVFLSKVGPWFKEHIEQALNKDSFTGEAIRKGETKDIWGIPMPDGVAHILNNMRLFSEIGRLNPANVFTKIGRDYFNSFTKDRPHRREAEQGERVFRFFTGINIRPVNQIQELRRKIFDTEKRISLYTMKRSRAARNGATKERENFEELIREESRFRIELGNRLQQVRQQEALEKRVPR